MQIIELNRRKINRFSSTIYYYMSKPIKKTPNENLVIACVNNFIVILFTPDIVNCITKRYLYQYSFYHVAFTFLKSRIVFIINSINATIIAYVSFVIARNTTVKAPSTIERLVLYFFGRSL